jgi:hypothetical protein
MIIAARRAWSTARKRSQSTCGALGDDQTSFRGLELKMTVLVSENSKRIVGPPAHRTV